MALIKPEGVDDCTQDWDGCSDVMNKDFDESESGNELENPIFVTVKEEPDDETLLDQDTFELTDSTQEAVPKIKEEHGNVSDASLVCQTLVSPQGVSPEIISEEAGPSDYCVPGPHQTGPITDTNKLARDTCYTLVGLHSESPNYCHHCDSQEVNPEECLIENKTQCSCKMALKKRNLTERKIPFGIASTSVVEKVIYENVDEKSKIEQSGVMQITGLRDEKSTYKNSGRTLGNLSASDHKEKQSCPSLNMSSTQVFQSLSGKKMYKCSECEKAFTYESILVRHMRTHTGERPHKCSQCGKAFCQSGDLTNHMRQHTGEKPFICNQCGKGFSRSGHLSAHMRQHTGEKPFKCNVCKKAFAYKCVLTRHMETHIFM